jgi:hypothetical protein
MGDVCRHLPALLTLLCLYWAPTGHNPRRHLYHSAYYIVVVDLDGLVYDGCTSPKCVLHQVW